MLRKNVGNRLKMGNRTTITTISVVLSLMGVLLFAQLISAAQSGDNPPPPGGDSSTDSTLEQFAPTTEELLAAPPSIERYIAGHSLPAGIVKAADLSKSAKQASHDTVSPNSMFDYIITVQNSGGMDIPVTVTDTLPEDVTFVAAQCPGNGCQYDSGTVIWEGAVSAGAQVDLVLSVVLNSDAKPGTTITSTAQIQGAELDVVDVSANITVNQALQTGFQYLPFVIYEESILPGPVTLNASRPNSQNKWTLSWSTSPGATNYELQESQDPDFATVVTYDTALQTTREVAKNASPFNVYYYRVRSKVGVLEGPWSNVERVVGGYYDEFEDEATGWSMRRSTYREKVFGFYENGKYVMQVLDRWDWGVSSPLQPAPEVPYSIDFEARIVAPANLLSFGMVFGGDWNGQNCPAGLSYDEWYKHTNCFNHFYNTNNIFFGPLKLLFERVDKLEWCPTCGGSPMKRLGDVDFSNTREYSNIDPEGWNRYTIEVREDSIKVFATKRGGTPVFQFEYNDTRWVNEPYFGFFASTDEYNNSTWRFEYLEVLPLD